MIKKSAEGCGLRRESPLSKAAILAAVQGFQRLLILLLLLLCSPLFAASVVQSPKGSELFPKSGALRRSPKPPPLPAAAAVPPPSVVLEWQPILDSKLRGYRILYGYSKTALTNILDAGLSTNATITGIPPAQLRYGVQAYGVNVPPTPIEQMVVIKNPPDLIYEVYGATANSLTGPRTRMPTPIATFTNTPPGLQRWFWTEATVTKDYSPGNTP